MSDRILTYAALGVASVLLFLGTAVISSGRPMTLSGVGGLVVQGFKFTTDGGGSATTSIPMASIYPSADNTWDLGSTLLKWRNLFVGSITATNVTVSGTCTGCGSGITFPLSQSVTFSANNQYDLATATNSARNVYASGTAYLNTINLGGDANMVLNNTGINFFDTSGNQFVANKDGSFSFLTNGGNSSYSMDGAGNILMDGGTGTLDLSGSTVTVGGGTFLFDGGSPNFYNFTVNGGTFAVTGSSSSTFSGGVQVNSGGLRVATLTSCNTIDTDSDGDLVCGSDETGGAGGFGGHSSFNIFPTTNNTFDLGFATSSWKDIYASGTVYLGGATPIRFGNSGGAEVYLPSGTGISALTLDTDGALTGNLLNFSVNNTQIGGLSALGQLTLLPVGEGNALYVQATSPQWQLVESDGPTDEKYWTYLVASGVYYHRAFNDALTLTADYMRLTRDGIGISSLEFPVGGAVSFGNITSNGKFAISNSGRATTTLFIETPTATPSNTPAIEFSATGSFRATPGVDTTGHAAFVFDTTAALASAKLLSIRENGSEVSYFDQAGGLFAPSSTVAAFRMTTSPSAGYVLTSDALGNASWAAAAGGSSFGGHSTFHIFPTVNNTYDLGFATSSWKNIFASSSAFIGGNISLGGDLIPKFNNQSNLGSPTGSFKNIYASSTIFGGSDVDIVGRYLRRGTPITSTTTLSITLMGTLATSTASSTAQVIPIPVPNACTAGEVRIIANQTVKTSFRTIVNIHKSNSTHTSTSSLFSVLGKEPDLGAGQFASSTVPDQNTSFAKGDILTASIDQYDGHNDIIVQVMCATPLF